MNPSEEYRTRRFHLVTAAHHLLISALPIKYPESRTALAEFVEYLDKCSLPSIDVEAVLLRCLSVIGRRISSRSADLVNNYLESGEDLPPCVARFRRSAEGLLQYKTAADWHVRRAIALIEERFRESGVRQEAIASAVDLTSVELAVRFKRETGLTFGQYVRAVRLNRGAILLVSGAKSIKEIWVEVGYSHASNFDHDFKNEFGLNPRQYRARAFTYRVNPPDVLRKELEPPRTVCLQPKGTRRETVLIVDDDECTREAIGHYLRIEGYTVALAASGYEGLRQADMVTPRVMLLDYHLPDIDGLACLHILRNRWTPEELPVILFTADMELEANDPDVQALGAKVASKLCDLEDVLRIIAAA